MKTMLKIANVQQTPNHLFKTVIDKNIQDKIKFSTQANTVTIIAFTGPFCP